MLKQRWCTSALEILWQYRISSGQRISYHGDEAPSVTKSQTEENRSNSYFIDTSFFFRTDPPFVPQMAAELKEDGFCFVDSVLYFKVTVFTKVS